MAARGGSKLMALWKQGWNEIPEVMGSSFYGLIGLVAVGAAIYKVEYTDYNNKRYKLIYSVFRPDDPRVQRVKKYDGSPGETYTPPPPKPDIC